MNPRIIRELEEIGANLNALLFNILDVSCLKTGNAIIHTARAITTFKAKLS